MDRLSVVFADAGFFEDVAMCADLQALGNRGEAELGGDRAAIPLHERRADFEDLVAVYADHLRDLGVVAGVGQVILEIGADIDLAQQGALGHDRKRAIDGGAGHGIVDGAGVVEEFLGREVFLAGERGLEDGEPLVGHAETFAGEVIFELFAGRVVAHAQNVGVAAGAVNWFVMRINCGPARLHGSGGAFINQPS